MYMLLLMSLLSGQFVRHVLEVEEEPVCLSLYFVPHLISSEADESILTEVQGQRDSTACHGTYGWRSSRQVCCSISHHNDAPVQVRALQSVYNDGFSVLF